MTTTLALPTVAEVELSADLYLRGVRDEEGLQVTLERRMEGNEEPEILAMWSSFIAGEIARVRVHRQPTHAFVNAGALSIALPVDWAATFAQELGLQYLER